MCAATSIPGHVIGPYYFGDGTDAAIKWLAANGIAYEQMHEQSVAVGDTMGTRYEGVTVVRFPSGTVGKLRKAGFKPQVVSSTTVNCGYCQRWYMPQREHDPCIASLPGVRNACCGHGVGRGYIMFENGLVVRFDTRDFERRHHRGGLGYIVAPDDERFFARED